MSSGEVERLAQSLSHLQETLQQQGLTFSQLDRAVRELQELPPDAPTQIESQNSLPGSLGDAVRRLYRNRPSTPSTVPDRFLRYQDLELIDQGGMGRIYRATDPQIGRSIAIKTLLPESSQDWKTLQRFQKEAETRASQHRPHLRHGTRLRRHLLLLHETRRRTIPLPVIKGPS